MGSTSWIGKAHSGSRIFSTSCSLDCRVASFSLSQVLDTTPGETYDLSFWSYHWIGSWTDVYIRWNGQEVGSYRQSERTYLQHGVAGLFATSEETRLELLIDPPSGWVVQSYFDDFAVTQSSVSPVPEAGTVSMVLAGLGLLGFMHRRRTNTARRPAADC